LTNQSEKSLDEQDFGRRQQIIDGALQVFASKKATNGILAASGIGSPGLIYHYWDKATCFGRWLSNASQCCNCLPT